MHKRKVFSGLSILLSLFSFSQSWQQLPVFPAAARDDGSAFVIGNNVHCGLGNALGLGPSADFHRFDPTTDTWSSIAVANLPALGRQYSCSFSYLNYGFIVSGVDANWNATNEAWRYDTVTNSWMQRAAMPDSVQGAACFFINNKAYICGGRNQANQCVSKVWEYDVTNNSWQQKNNMPGGRWRASAAAINNKGYLLFGADSLGKFSNKLFEYDAGNDSWTQIDVFPGQGRTYAAACAVNNLLFVGLGIDSANVVYNDCYLYNVNAHQWINQNPLPSFGRKGCMAFAFNNSVYITAGIDGGSNRLVETWKAGSITATENFKNDEPDFSIYPNPSHDVLYFGKACSVKVLNPDGVELMSYVGIKQIDLSTLPAGLYFLHMQVGGAARYKKLILCR